MLPREKAFPSATSGSGQLARHRMPATGSSLPPLMLPSDAAQREGLCRCSRGGAKVGSRMTHIYVCRMHAMLYCLSPAAPRLSLQRLPLMGAEVLGKPAR